MGIVEQLQGEVVGLDTAPLIYFIEKHVHYHPLVRPLFVALDRGQFTAVTSTVTLVEVLVHPLRHGQADLVNQYRDILFHANHLTMLDLGPSVAMRAAQLRAQQNLRTPDAVQLATALHFGAGYFLTNDQGLKNFPLLDVLLVDDLAP